jgi:hypothetical protein
MIVKKEKGFLKLKKDGIKEGEITVFNKENNKKLYRLQAGEYRESLGQSAYDELTNDEGVEISECENKKEFKKRGRPPGSKNQNKQEQEPQSSEQQKKEHQEQINKEQQNTNQENEPASGQMEIDQQ